MIDKDDQFESRVDGFHFLALGGRPGTGLRAIGQAVRVRLGAEGFGNAADNDVHAPTRGCAVRVPRETKRPRDLLDQRAQS